MRDRLGGLRPKSLKQSLRDNMSIEEQPFSIQFQEVGVILATYYLSVYLAVFLLLFSLSKVLLGVCVRINSLSATVFFHYYSISSDINRTLGQ